TWWETSGPLGSQVHRPRSRSSSRSRTYVRWIRNTSSACCPPCNGMKPGVFCFNPPYGVRMGADAGEKQLLTLYSGMGRAFARFKGWRAARFVANPRFVDTFGHAPVMTTPDSHPDLRGAFLVYGF